MILLPSLLSMIPTVMASFAIGMLWYSPVMFGPMWVKLKQFDPKKFKAAQKKMGPSYILSGIGTIIQAVALYQILYAFDVRSLSESVWVSFWVWLGFVAVTQMTMMIFDSKKFNIQLFIIDTSYQLASLLSIGILLTVLN